LIEFLVVVVDFPEKGVPRSALQNPAAFIFPGSHGCLLLPLLDTVIVL
jgi:hypothetical protein